MEIWLKKEVSKIICHKASKTYTINHDDQKIDIKIPIFSYPNTMRMIASNLLDKKTSRQPGALQQEEFKIIFINLFKSLKIPPFY